MPQMQPYKEKKKTLERARTNEKMEIQHLETRVEGRLHNVYSLYNFEYLEEIHILKQSLKFLFIFNIFGLCTQI